MRPRFVWANAAQSQAVGTEHARVSLAAKSGCSRERTQADRNTPRNQGLGASETGPGCRRKAERADMISDRSGTRRTRKNRDKVCCTKVSASAANPRYTTVSLTQLPPSTPACSCLVRKKIHRTIHDYKPGARLNRTETVCCYVVHMCFGTQAGDQFSSTPTNSPSESAPVPPCAPVSNPLPHERAVLVHQHREPGRRVARVVHGISFRQKHVERTMLCSEEYESHEKPAKGEGMRREDLVGRRAGSQKISSPPHTTKQPQRRGKNRKIMWGHVAIPYAEKPEQKQLSPSNLLPQRPINIYTPPNSPKVLKAAPSPANSRTLNVSLLASSRM